VVLHVNLRPADFLFESICSLQSGTDVVLERDIGDIANAPMEVHIAANKPRLVLNEHETNLTYSGFGSQEHRR